jgi:hypothetical protein
MSKKFNPGVGDSTTKKSRKPAYHIDDHQTDTRLVKPPTRKPGESLGTGKQEPVIRKEHSDTHPELLQKKPRKASVLPVDYGTPEKSKTPPMKDGVNN